MDQINTKMIKKTILLLLLICPVLAMAQGHKEIEAVQKMMNLSESERQFLITASRGQGLFVISQDTRIPIQVHLRDEEKLLFGDASGR